MTIINKGWVLKRRPEDTEIISSDNFDLVDIPLDELEDGDLLVKTLVLGTSPAQRAYTIHSRLFHGAVDIGAVMRGRGIGEVVESRHPDFKPGDLVAGSLGWQQYSIQKLGLGPEAGVDVLSVQRIDASVEPALTIGTLGQAGYTALYGLKELGEISAGKTVLVSAAAGGVGAMACQIAKAMDCRVVGIAGGPEKCTWLEDYLGVDATVDYKAGNIAQDIAEACPDGVDIFFDNVGGVILNTALENLAMHGRVVLCGMISTEYERPLPPGPQQYVQLLYKRARMEGFVIWDHVDRFPEFYNELRAMFDAGKLKPVEDIAEGIAEAPGSLQSLFIGGNTGIKITEVAKRS